MNLFKKSIKHEGLILTDASKDEELSMEEPIAVAAPNGPNSILRPAVPKGTAFNKKTIGAIGIVLGIIVFFSLVFAFSPQRTKNASADPFSGKLSKDTQGNDYSNTTPDELNKVPGNYNQLSQRSPEYSEYQSSYPQLGDPTPPVIGGMNSASGQGSRYSIPTPPAIQSIPLTITQQGHPGAESQPTQQTPEQKEIADVRKSPIRFGSTSVVTGLQKQDSNDPISKLIDSALAANQKLFNQLSPPGSNLEQVQQQPQQDQNMQDEKRDFQNQSRMPAFYSKSLLIPPVSSYEVKAGSIIPVTLITGINSDLPGNIICQVRENVYDTVTGRYLLIPQGSRVIGVYDSKVAFGQDRVLVVWTRLILPNGSSIDLQGLSGIDQSGYSGLKDKVNNHYGKIVGGVLVSSLIAYGAKKATEGSAQDDPFMTSVAQNAVDVGAKLTDKNINIQPTIEIQPGSKFNLFVDKDFILRPYTEK